MKENEENMKDGHMCQGERRIILISTHGMNNIFPEKLRFFAPYRQKLGVKTAKNEKNS